MWLKARLPQCRALFGIRLLLLTLILTLAPPVRAQVVNGMVYNDSTAGPVAGALVKLLTLDSIPLDSTRTDVVGRFELAVWDAELLRLLVAADDYVVWSSAIQVKTDETTSVLVPLIPEPGVQVGRTRPSEVEGSVDVFGQVVQRGTGVPIESAEVTLIGRGTRALTTVTGRFNLRDVDPGEVQFRVEHLAFEPEESKIDLIGGWAYQVRVELAETAIPLEGIEVTVQSRPFAKILQRAYERVDRAIGGYFIVEEDLSLRGYPSVFRAVEVVPGFRRCPPTLFVDGVLIHNDADFWRMSTVEVELIEVYSSIGTVPFEFQGLGVKCAVAVWTKRGGG